MSWTYDHEPETARKRQQPLRRYSSSLPEQSLHLADLMESYLRKRHLSYVLSVQNLWYPSNTAGDSSPRIVMPATSRYAANRFWQARAMDANEKRYQSPHAPRGDALIVVWPFTKTIERAVVTEGPTDALAAAGTGPCLGIALMGNTPSFEIIEHLSSWLRGHRVTLMADTDSVDSMARLMVTLLGMDHQMIDVRSAAPWKDLSDMPPTERIQTLYRR